MWRYGELGLLTSFEILAWNYSEFSYLFLFLMQILMQPSYSPIKMCKIWWKAQRWMKHANTDRKPSFSRTVKRHRSYIFWDLPDCAEFGKVYVALVNICCELWSGNNVTARAQFPTCPEAFLCLHMPHLQMCLTKRLVLVSDVQSAFSHD